MNFVYSKYYGNAKSVILLTFVSHTVHVIDIGWTSVCPSVRLSVCPSHAGIVSELINFLSHNVLLNGMLLHIDYIGNIK